MQDSMATVNFKGEPLHTSGELPPVGTKAPDFSLIDTDLKEVSLEDFRGMRKLLYCVPSLDTSVCSLSAKKFNQTLQSRKDVVALIISADLPFAQKRVCTQENVHNIKTLSLMRSKSFAERYGLLITDGPLQGLCARAVFVLDKDNTILYVELVPEITQEPNYEQALKALTQ